MSALAMVYLQCDAPGCVATQESDWYRARYDGKFGPMTSDVRDDARAAGWRRLSSEQARARFPWWGRYDGPADLCLDHAGDL